MPMIQPDLSDVGPIEAGTYKARIDSCAPGVSKAGNPKLDIQFSIFTGGEKPKTRKIGMPYSGAGAFGFASLLRACHMAELANAYQSKDDVKPAFDTDSLVGQELMVTVEADTWNDQLTDKITGYLTA